MAHARHRALVVDDERVIREAVARSMSAESFQVETASDGQEALAKIQENHYDLIVTDLRMPNKHGYAMITEVLQADDPPHIVVLTGIAEPRLVKDLISRGVLDVVQKPVDFRVFAVKMQAIFQRRGWRDSFEESMDETVSSGRYDSSRQDRRVPGLVLDVCPRRLDQVAGSGGGVDSRPSRDPS